MVDERIVFTALHARNYEATVSFYRDVVGVPLEEEDHGDEGPHFEYSWQEPYFPFAIFPLKPNEDPTHVELSFITTRTSQTSILEPCLPEYRWSGLQAGGRGG
jgi:catechol 2,3-dioxygenase-like lactoylglutathione lyase family enzyme